MNQIPQALLESKSVYIETNPDNYFTWTSGKRSPIYCDNRQLISYPKFRKNIVFEFTSYIREHYPKAQLIAGTATAGIPWAAWIADELDLPLVYIRSKPKEHGKKSAIEGKVIENQNTLIIEDLISTGKSSINAYKNAKESGLNVLSVLSIFNYSFKEAEIKFQDNDLNFHSLCSITDLLEYAKNKKLLNEQDIETVLNWKNLF